LEVLEKQKTLEAINEATETKDVQPSLLQKEQTTHKEYIRDLRDAEKMWRIKSRSLWLQSGDNNTTFFHKQAKVRQCKNNVEEINLPTGETIQDFEEIKQHDSRFYSQLYMK
jgi:hypothetical protein